ncbi:MAG: tetratricopeptide repeat protein [Gammaproteobacteria bacterium]|nr:tetratricopeptide repeat protein [Gammaproteobacteria bacterium]
MSLVNQMLKDLEQRRAELPRGDSLRGLRAAPPSAEPQRNFWPTVLIAAALGGVGYGWWLTFAKPGLEPGLEAPPVAAANAAPTGWVAENANTQPPSATEIDAAWDKTWEPRTAEAVSVAALEESRVESRPEYADVAATEPAAPTPSTIKQPAPQPTPTTTVTTVASAERTSMGGMSPATSPVTSSMHKTPRALSPTEQAAQDYAQALDALRSGDTARAEERLRAALDKVPGHAQAAETLSAILLQQHRGREAEDVLAEAIAAAPQAPRLLVLHARILVESGADSDRDAEAVALLQTPTLSNDAEAQALLGALQQRRGNDAEAATAYRQALTRAPQRGTWWLGLAISLERSRQPAAALEAYRRALTDRALGDQVAGYVRGRIATLDNSPG